MSIKHRIYHRLKELVATPYGVSIMCVLSFLESCVSPITPLVMLIPMILMHKDKSMKYVNLATVFALFGSIFGYALGYYVMLHIDPFIISWGYTESFTQVKQWFASYGLFILLPSSLLPFLPFKLFTIAAGAMHLEFIPFIIVVILVRWVHFVIIPMMIYYGKMAYLYKYEEGLTGDKEDN